MNKYDPFSICLWEYENLHSETPFATKSTLLPIYNKRFNDVCWLKKWQSLFQWIDLSGENEGHRAQQRLHKVRFKYSTGGASRHALVITWCSDTNSTVELFIFNPLTSILFTHFFIFFCAAFFFTSCNRFMALSWDSWDVGALSPAAAFDPLPLFPLPPPLLPPFPPALAWELLGELAPDEADPFPWFSPLEERFSGCLPRVNGGGGFRGTWLEPFPLPLPGIFAPLGPDLAPASPDSPTGFWPVEVVRVLWLPLGPEEPSLEVAGRDGLVLAPNAAQPVRPLPEEELLPVGLADVVDAWNDKQLAQLLKCNPNLNGTRRWNQKLWSSLLNKAVFQVCVGKIQKYCKVR